MLERNFQVVHLLPQSREDIANRGLCLNVTAYGTTGTCVLECSTDLVRWIPIRTNQVTNLTFEVIDDTASQAPMRFYRVRLSP